MSIKNHIFSSGAFGSVTYGRRFTSDSYRYGFNGKEKDNETYGTGNAYNFGDRIFDPRLGKWLSLDPEMQVYPSLSPYNFVGNCPIRMIDPTGRRIVDANGHRVRVKIVSNDDGSYYLAFKFSKKSSGDDRKKFVEDGSAIWTSMITTSEGRKELKKANNVVQKIHYKYHYEGGKGYDDQQAEPMPADNKETDKKGITKMKMGQTSKENGIIQIELYEENYKKEKKYHDTPSTKPKDIELNTDPERPYKSIDEFQAVVGTHETKHATEWGLVSLKQTFQKILDVFKSADTKKENQKEIEERNPIKSDKKAVEELRKPK